MATNTIAISPAAGPDTLTFEPLKYPTIIPAITPQIIPPNGGAPLATAIPKQRGKATRNTTIPDKRSDFRYFVVSFILLALMEFYKKCQLMFKQEPASFLLFSF